LSACRGRLDKISSDPPALMNERADVAIETTTAPRVGSEDAGVYGGAPASANTRIAVWMTGRGQTAKDQDSELLKSYERR